MIVEVKPRMIRGNWEAGWTLDWCTTAGTNSTSQSPNTRTGIGELIYGLKVTCDYTNIEPLAELSTAFLRGCEFLRSTAVIIPVPHSIKDRPFQPVPELAQRIGRHIGLRVDASYLTAIPAEARPGGDATPRRKHRAWSGFAIRDRSYAGSSVLVIDDVYLTGKTLRTVAESIYTQGQVGCVYVLTMARRRRRKRG